MRRLGLVGGDEGLLDANGRAPVEAGKQQLAQPDHDARVHRPDRQHRDHRTVHELDPLPAEEVEGARPIVLGAREPARTGVREMSEHG